MTKHYRLLTLVPVLLFVGAAHAQYPMMDMVANELIQKYENMTCEDMWKQKGAPKTPRQMNAIQLLQGDPAMRTAFIDKVAPTIVNKMFSCGMIP
jgi:hypothetical protein